MFVLAPVQIDLSARIQKQKQQKTPLSGVLSGPSRGCYLGQVSCNIKMANLAQIITPESFAHNLCFKEYAEPPPSPQFL